MSGGGGGVVKGMGLSWSGSFGLLSNSEKNNEERKGKLAKEDGAYERPRPVDLVLVRRAVGDGLACKSFDPPPSHPLRFTSGLFPVLCVQRLTGRLILSRSVGAG